MRQGCKACKPGSGCAVYLQSRSRCPPPWDVHHSRWNVFPRRIRTRIASGSDTGLIFRRVLSKSPVSQRHRAFFVGSRVRQNAGISVRLPAFWRTRLRLKICLSAGRTAGRLVAGEMVAGCDSAIVVQPSWVCEHRDGGGDRIGSHSGCGITW